MAFNGSGTFNRNTGIYTGATAWQQTRDVSRNIRADDHDNHDQDIATGLSTVICKDGQTSPTANLPMAGFRHLNVGAGVARTDYLRVDQMQDRSVAHCGTSAGTANAQTISATPALTAYTAGQLLSFVAGAALTNTGPTTINVNGLGVRTLVIQGLAAIYPGAIQAGGLYYLAINGTNAVLLNPHTGIQTYTPTLTPSSGGTLSGISHSAEFVFNGAYCEVALNEGFTVVTSPIPAVRCTLPQACVGGIGQLYGGGVVNIGSGNRAGIYAPIDTTTIETYQYDAASYTVGSGRYFVTRVRYRWI
jgi:hypothetical protein